MIGFDTGLFFRILASLQRFWEYLSDLCHYFMSGNAMSEQDTISYHNFQLCDARIFWQACQQVCPAHQHMFPNRLLDFEDGQEKASLYRMELGNCRQTKFLGINFFLIVTELWAQPRIRVVRHYRGRRFCCPSCPLSVKAGKKPAILVRNELLSLPLCVPVW
jgi:hypothetical protein